MYKKRQRIKKDGIRVRLRGLKLERKRKFERVIETDSGVMVRSKYERVCANYLHKRNIRFQYEPLMLLDGRKFRPDFFLPDHNTFIEICGYGHMPHYNSRVSDKVKLYEKYELKAIFIHHRGSGSLRAKIESALVEAGVMDDDRDVS